MSNFLLGIKLTRVDIIVGESITLAVSLVLVNNTRVVAGRRNAVVGSRWDGRLGGTTVEEESGAGEGRAETRDDSQVNGVVAVLLSERSGVATPDVISGGLGVRAVVTVASQRVAGDLAVDVAGIGLGVDHERSVGEVGPDSIDVWLPVVGEAGVIGGDIILGSEGTESASVSGSNAHLSPGELVGGGLSAEIVADLLEGAGSETLGELVGAVGVVELHGKDNTDKVDVGDVGVDLEVGGVGKLDEAPGETGGRILGVGGSGLDERVAVVSGNHEEGELTNDKVDTTRDQSNGDVDGGGGTLGTERDGNGLGDVDGSGRAAGGRVDKSAVAARANEDDLVVGVETGNVGVDTVSEGVDQVQAEVASDGVGSLHAVDGLGGLGVEGTVQGVVLGDGDILDATGIGDSEGGAGLPGEEAAVGSRQGCTHESGENCEGTHCG